MDLASGAGIGGDAEGDTLTGIEAVRGSNLADTLIGNAADNILDGEAGDDTLFGGGGADILLGNVGNDILHGDEGDDILAGGVGDDVLYGGNGDDLLLDEETNSGSDHFDGGKGSDTVSYEDTFLPASGITVDLSTGIGSRGAQGDTYVSIENIVGTSLDDIINGNADANRLDGSSGNDTLSGGDGVDTLLGGEGRDTLFGGSDEDVLDGGSGRDQLEGNAGDDLLRGGQGDDLIRGGAGSDTIRFVLGDGVDTVAQTDVNDGASAHDVIVFENIATEQLFFHQNGNDLVVDVLGSNGDAVILTDWFNMDVADRIDEFRTTDGVLSAGNVQMLVDAMASFSATSAGDVSVSAETMDALQPTLAAAWA